MIGISCLHRVFLFHCVANIINNIALGVFFFFFLFFFHERNFLNTIQLILLIVLGASQGVLMVKNMPASARDTGTLA